VVAVVAAVAAERRPLRLFFADADADEAPAVLTGAVTRLVRSTASRGWAIAAPGSEAAARVTAREIAGAMAREDAMEKGIEKALGQAL
jgi:hypothetical protein